ncbi:6-hydroxymethylpterin diphosphokinase MptE-like protein [Hydrogenobacter hydrogenophilus]|uniref:Uncharacterized conserved protein n=1 Tax=Hydrogenobacter hydrogenophilus TaxID=35835 RepID=A0A285NW42_9AQUI|nr:6-hydroxymethylpterin diphosphokinase MptE-like protein [Hydrogenobacter hydrogenophilus]SNZ12116.1 Uncharacterized conserved protein [Hydrogenobacter hydrogenophilus]
MIKDQRLQIELMRRRKDKNLIAIQRYAPHLMDLVNRKGKIKCGIYVGQNGEIDLVMEGSRVYNADPRAVAQIQLENFKKQKEGFYLIPSTNRENPEKILDHKYKGKIIDLFGVEPQLDKLRDMVSQELKDGQHIGALFSVGLGFGYHLELLTDTYDIKYLFVVEKDPEVFKTSLYTANWEKLLAHYSCEGRAIVLFVGDDPEELAKHMVYSIGYLYNTPLLYWSPVFIHLFGPFYEQVGKAFSDRIQEISMGWGFFQDELWSLEYTIENIKRELPLFYGKKTVPSDAVAFVIGAGPSLEYALDFIKQSQHRAVIFSCGSSIGTLYEEGIKPDFHVEIERTKMTYDALIKSASTDYLKELTAMYNNPMYPPVADLFKESLMWLKPNDAGSSLFPPDIPRIGYSNPTVVNGGLSLAIHMGFKEIYLFGTDMGYKDPKKHHARGNVALKEGTEFYKEKEVQEYELEGNFGGKVYTNGLLLWARSMIQDLLKMTKGVKVYNTSDGAKIEGTIPIKVGEITLRNFKKTEAIKLINSNFSKDYLKDNTIHQKAYTLLKEAQELQKVAHEFLSKQPRDLHELAYTLNAVFVWLYERRDVSPLWSMLRGGYLQLEHLVLFLAHQEGKVPEGIHEVIRDYLKECAQKLSQVLEPFLENSTHIIMKGK